MSQVVRDGEIDDRVFAGACHEAMSIKFTDILQTNSVNFQAFKSTPTFAPPACFACMLLFYIAFKTYINCDQHIKHLIRNEKVGCSIHLSGTKRKPLIRKSQGLFACACCANPCRTTSWRKRCDTGQQRHRQDQAGLAIILRPAKVRAWDPSAPVARMRGPAATTWPQPPPAGGGSGPSRFFATP